MAEYLRADYNDDENKKHGKEKIIWTYPNKKQIVLLRDTTCDAEVVITPEVDNGDSKSRSDDANIEKRLSVPLWKGGEGKENHKLSEEIEKVLSSLNNKSRKSASFCIQPIGQWVFKCYFKCYLYEINKFYNDFSSVCSVEYLFLVIKDENLYQVASDVADVFLQDKASRTPNPVFRTIKVSIHEGHLHEAQTDVLVNTISTNLDLKIGTISASLLSKGGIGLQKEISRNGKPAQYGRVIKTSSCQLRCKAVYHGALKPYHAQDDSVQIFEQFLHECLEQASNSKYKSIAFPAIGTGKLGYPSDMVANLMIRAVMELEKSKPKTSLKEVKFVIHRSCPEVYQAFQDQLRLLQSGHEEEIGFELPSTWSKMASKENLKVMMIQITEKEYQDVQLKFLQSVGGNRTIIKLERIQNKTLYQQYEAKKKLIEQNNPGHQNEHSLWHGTSVDSVDSINMHGFNRSYCGKNATAHGDGVYFAKNASYSAKDIYSKPDPANRKRMYLCRVLTGQYTKGSIGIRVPPAKSSSNPNDLYDSVVNDTSNPEIFVIFNDTQAIPEYLITFT